MYTLIGIEYAYIFKSLSDQIAIHEGIVIESYAGVMNTDYAGLEIHYNISPETIGHIVFFGSKVWTYQGHIFISEELKGDLAKAGSQHFTFSQGFEGYAGSML